jgi:hypothetical protein
MSRTRRGITSGVLAMSFAVSVLLGSNPAASAATEKCWAAIKEDTLKAARVVPIMDSHMTLRWCAEDGKVTKFFVDNADIIIRNNSWAQRDSNPVVLKQNDFGNESIYVIGDFPVAITFTGPEVKFGSDGAGVAVHRYDLGHAGLHYDIQLHSNGVIEGTVGS